MFKSPDNPEKIIPLLAVRLEELRRHLSQLKPDDLAQKSGAVYRQNSPETGEFELPLWSETIYLTYPGFDIRFKIGDKPPNLAQQALILYYLQTADGTPPARKYISFAELPNGRFYNQAFQGYTGRALWRIFQDDHDAFKKVALQNGGSPVPIGDAAFSFQVLPRVNLLAMMWQGDEDFPSSYQILFDASVSHYLPTDACAIAGSMLTQRLIKALKSR